MNSKNSGISDPHNLTDKINLKRAFTMHGKILKSHTKLINLKYQFQHEMKSLNYLMDHILY